MKISLQITALLAATCVAGAASAQSLATMPGAPGGHGQVKALVIASSRGLDLASDVGADQFLGRLTAAVNAACDDRPTEGPPLRLAHTAGFDRCRSQALETAMTYVHSPIVKWRYAAIEGKDNLHLARR